MIFVFTFFSFLLISSNLFSNILAPGKHVFKNDNNSLVIRDRVAEACNKTTVFTNDQSIGVFYLGIIGQ